MSVENLHIGKTYLVTGAGRGIGKAVVERLSDLEAKVYALSKNADNLNKLKDDFPDVITICVDLGDWNATRESLENLEAVDCVINNAAVAITSDFFSIKPDDIDSQVNVNLKAVINVSQIIAEKMIKDEKNGSIVNIGSVGGKKASVSTQTVAYACTKAALEMLTKIMAISLGPHKIRVNSVCPGIVETDMLNEILESIGENKGTDYLNQVRTSLEERTPSGLMVSPMSDIVNTILFMASNAATQITGQSLDIDGGLSVV